MEHVDPELLEAVKIIAAFIQERGLKSLDNVQADDLPPKVRAAHRFCRQRALRALEQQQKGERRWPQC